jgi:hypothetical protein
MFIDRLTEPLHLNILAIFVAIFGTFRAKISFDLVLLQHYAYSVLSAAEMAKRLGLPAVSVVEFGVAQGKGMLNLCHLGKKVQKITGVEVRVYGFDSGEGLPDPRDYRDHPELYKRGEYLMSNTESLLKKIPENGTLIFGDIAETAGTFLEGLDRDAPLGFIAVDVDYYWSTKAALRILDGSPDKYLPTTLIYLDDIRNRPHNPWCGELLAVEEFNKEHELRKIARYDFLKHERIFRNAYWVDQMFTLHVLDHPTRTDIPK